MNNDEKTRFLMWLPCYCISWIYKPTKKSRCMYSLLVYNENHKQTIQYTKLHLLKQLALFKMNASVQGITKYILYHTHVQMLTEEKGKKNI